jgi:hypothetical protein
MAKATATLPKTETKTVVVCPGKITLELSAEEAQLLIDIGAKVAGSPGASRRGIYDGIVNALRGALGTNYGASSLSEQMGVKLPWGDLTDLRDHISETKNNGLYFRDRAPKADSC